uniref:Uncharacterized protein n=1 Tax=Setaria italica TaxID=4555 RepID=K3ZPD7_SETIT
MFQQVEKHLTHEESGLYTSRAELSRKLKGR